MTEHRGAVALNWRSVALPPEHGSWSLVLEPLVLGLAVAPSWGGLVAGIAAFAAFLAYRPFKLAVGDRRRKRRYPRSVVAEGFALTFGAVAVVAAAALLLIAGPRPFLPLVAAAPLGVIFAFYDLRPGRALEAEITAPAAFGAVAAAIPLAAGWAAPESFALWMVAVGRAIPSVAYVRERLAQGRGEPSQPAPVLAAHLLALGSVLLLAWADLLPWGATLAFLLLSGRAALGLSRFRRPAPAKRIGILEIFWGALSVVLVAAAYRLG
jgi:hypothetical protein